MKPSRQTVLSGVRSLFQSRLVRASISVLLLVLLITRFDLGELADILGHIVPGLLLLGILFFIVASIMSVLKWQLILKAQNISVPFFYLVSLFYIGFFFSNFLPTNFGGDIIKIYKLSRTTGEPLKVTSSVFLDRVSSTVALLLIAIIPTIIEVRLLGIAVSAIVLSMVIITCVTIALAVNINFARRLGNLPLLRLNPMGLHSHARNFYFSLHDFRTKKATLAAMMAISLLYQFVQIFAVYILALSLGIHLSVLYYFIFIPVIQIVSMIPVSLNGLGVREGVWVLLFGQAGVPSADAFSMSILILLVMTATSLFGGIFYLFDRSLPTPQTKVDHGQP